MSQSRFSAIEGGKAKIIVMVKNVANLGAFQFEFHYDPTVLRVDSCILGDFIKSTSREVDPIGPISINNRNALFFGAVTQGGKEGPNGSGILATLILEAKAAGNTEFVLRNVLLADIRGDSIKVERKRQLD